MNSEENNQHKMSGSNYGRFFSMLGLSFVAMYITMYLNTYEFDHVYFSLTRFYMTCLGIAAMAVIMLSLMLNMYKNKKKKHCYLCGKSGAVCKCFRPGKSTETYCWRCTLHEGHDTSPFYCCFNQ